MAVPVTTKDPNGSSNGSSKVVEFPVASDQSDLKTLAGNLIERVNQLALDKMQMHPSRQQLNQLAVRVQIQEDDEKKALAQLIKPLGRIAGYGHLLDWRGQEQKQAFHLLSDIVESNNTLKSTVDESLKDIAIPALVEYVCTAADENTNTLEKETAFDLLLQWIRETDTENFKTVISDLNKFAVDHSPEVFVKKLENLLDPSKTNEDVFYVVKEITVEEIFVKKLLRLFFDIKTDLTKTIEEKLSVKISATRVMLIVNKLRALLHAFDKAGKPCTSINILFNNAHQDSILEKLKENEALKEAVSKLSSDNGELQNTLKSFIAQLEKQKITEKVSK